VIQGGRFKEKGVEGWWFVVELDADALCKSSFVWLYQNKMFVIAEPSSTFKILKKVEDVVWKRIHSGEIMP
jgi:hypothetical protein